MSRLLPLAAAVAALVLLAAGCGVGSTEESAAAAAAGDYLAALADGDYAAACGKLAPAAKPEGDCAQGVEASVAETPAGEISDDNDGRLRLDVQGATATATFESGATVELTRRDGEWLVSSPYSR